MRRAICALLAVLFLAAPAVAAPVRAGDLTLKDLQLRASLGQIPNTAAYFTIVNAGGRPDRLLSASCACASMVMIHRSETKDGMSMMVGADGVTVPPKGQVQFAPGGLHLMVMGLKSPLKDGESRTFVLQFEHAGAVKAEFPVRALIETSPGGDHH